jgi:hypothetical protein
MGALWAMNEQCRLEASHGLSRLPASHSRRGYGARSGRSAYTVAERRRRLEWRRIGCRISPRRVRAAATGLVSRKDLSMDSPLAFAIVG